MQLALNNTHQRLQLALDLCTNADKLLLYQPQAGTRYSTNAMQPGK